ARSTFTATLAPGTVLRDTVRIVNTGNRSVVVDLYAADAYLVGERGAFAIRNRNERKTGVSRWVRFGAKTRFRVNARKAIEVPFEIRVPKNAQPGDHVGAVMTAGVRTERTRGSVNIKVRRRIGARIYLRVPGKLTPQVAVSSLAAEGKPALFPYIKGKGKTTVSYEITNTGNVIMEPTAELQLRGPFGNVVDTIPVDVPELLPGTSVVQTTSFDTLPPYGLLEAQLVVKSDDVADARSAQVWSVPWAPALVLLVAGLVWWTRRRLRRRGAPDADAEPMPA
ncbi:MAG: hypothetical protein LT071_11490, partial [Nocardioides sp.]|nr:hypothetical protein [Nocardioides sp.]